MTEEGDQRPWTTYRFFDVTQSYEEKSGYTMPSFHCADSGHGLVCLGENIIARKKNEQNSATLHFFDSQFNFQHYPLPENSQILQVKMGTYYQHCLACCLTSSHYKFWLINTATMTQVGEISIPKDDMHKFSNIAASPKVKRFAILTDDNNIKIYQHPFTAKSKPEKYPCQFTDPITNYILTSDQNLQRILYVTTTTQTIAIHILNRTSPIKYSQPFILANEGAQPGFVSITSDGRLVVVRGMVVSSYDKQKEIPNSRYVIEQVPRLIGFMKNSYLIACFPTPNSSSSVRIYNSKTHATFGRCPDGDRVCQILTEWNSVILILGDGDAHSFTKMTETDMHQKIQQLVKNEQFDVALDIAESQSMSRKVISNIHRQRGDSYQEKRMYDKSIQEYIQTIGDLEPSYVITRFRDPQHAEQLVLYLEELSRHNLETKQHTTLRFNCYTKLRQKTKLDGIVEDCIQKAKEGLEPTFDLETAVQVLVLCDFREQALEIAKAYRLHTIYTKMLSDTKDYHEIFNYLRGVETSIALTILTKYGQDMMESFLHEETNTTVNQFRKFLVDICVNGLRKTVLNDEEKEKMNPDKIMCVFTNYPEQFYSWLKELIRVLLGDERRDEITENVWTSVIEMAVTIPMKDSLGKPLLDHEQKQIIGNQEEATYYFNEAQGKFNSEQLLMIFKAEHCHFGQLLIFEHLGYYQEILKISHGPEIVEACRKYGPKDPYLWRIGLVMLSQARDKENLQKLIDLITETKSVPLLAVLQILKNNGFANYGFIRGLAKRTFGERQEHIHELMSQYKSLEDYVSNQEKHVLALTYDHFIAKSTRCDGCKGVIDLPAKHFLCGHSFHMACLGDDLTKCAVCKEKQEKIVLQKVESYMKAHDGQTVNLGPGVRFKYKILDLVSDTPDQFQSMSGLLQTDIMTIDEGSAEFNEARQLHSQYTGQPVE